jgi:hypothetical protein
MKTSKKIKIPSLRKKSNSKKSSRDKRANSSTKKKSSRSRKNSRKIQLVYLGRLKGRLTSHRKTHHPNKWTKLFNTSSVSSRVFKHDIFFGGDNFFDPSSLTYNPIKNDQDDNGNYEDPISGDSITTDDEVVCLGSQSSYWCYTLDTIQRQLKVGKAEDPMTRRPIDPSIVKTILVRDFPELENKSLDDIRNLIEEVKRRYGLLRLVEREGETVSIAEVIDQMFGNRLYRIEISDIKSLIISDDFNDDPDLIFNVRNQDIYERDEEDEEDEGLQQIIFGKRFNQPLDDTYFPDTVDEIIFGDDFNQPIDNIRWPSNLTVITFGKHFNQPIEDVEWPDKIDAIDFSDDFNQPVVDVEWPIELVGLTFGKSFNQPVKGMELPPRLVKLEFAGSFNQSLNGVLFNKNLKVIFLPEGYNQRLSRSFIPAGVELLRRR